MTDDLELTAEDAKAPITRAGCLVVLAVAHQLDPRVEATKAKATVWHMQLGTTPRGPGLRAGDVLAAVQAHYEEEDARPVMTGDIIGWVADADQQWVWSGWRGRRPVGYPQVAGPGLTAGQVAVLAAAAGGNDAVEARGGLGALLAGEIIPAAECRRILGQAALPAGGAR